MNDLLMNDSLIDVMEFGISNDLKRFHLNSQHLTVHCQLVSCSIYLLF